MSTCHMDIWPHVHVPHGQVATGNLSDSQPVRNLSDSEPLLFSGCYFVASGAMPDRQAFLASVFKKATNEEEELEWGSEALAEENRMQAGVQVLMVVNGALVAAIVGLLIYHFKFK